MVAKTTHSNVISNQEFVLSSKNHLISSQWTMQLLNGLIIEREREKLTLCLIREKKGNKSTYGDKEERNM